MSKTAREVIADSIRADATDPHGLVSVDVKGCTDRVIAALAAAGFVIVPKAVLEIYTNPEHWEMQRQNMGHGDSGTVLIWRGPAADRGYFGPTKGREYAVDALAAANDEAAK